jgi:ATP-dependent helicase/DNAse subunit B
MVGSYDLCAHRSFIEYNIGIKQPYNAASMKGTIVHKVMEILAQSKLCQQDGDVGFDDEMLGEVYVDEIQPISILSRVFEKYQEENPQMDLDEAMYKETSRLVKKAIAYSGGEYDPRNLDIVAVEHPFDMVINKPWAKYSYESPAGIVEGQLALKGTIDLVIKHDDNTYEIRDYKTSARAWDWAKNSEKTDENIYKDFQIMLYYYAACHAFPKIKNILFTIYFINVDKPMLITFDRTDLPMIENVIRKKFETMVADKKPKLNVSFRCKFCPFSKDIQKGTKKTVCEFFRDEIKTIGFDRTMAEHARWDQIGRYGSGGGKVDRE